MTAGDNRFAELGLNPDEVFVWNRVNRKFLDGSMPMPRLAPSSFSFVFPWVAVQMVMLLCVLCSAIGWVGNSPATLFTQWEIIGILFIPHAYYGFRLTQLRRQQIAAWQTVTLISGKIVSCKRVATSQGNGHFELAYQFLSPVNNQQITDIQVEFLPPQGKWPEPGTPIVVVVYSEPLMIPKFNPFGRVMANSFVL